MRKLLKRCRGLLWWLASAVGVYALFLLLRQSRAAMNWLTERVVGPLESRLAALCAGVPFSVAEVLCLTAIAMCLWWAVWLIRSLVTKKDRVITLCQYGLFLLCAVLTVYDGFCLLWGVNYYADTFSEKSGIYEASGTPEQLEALTMRYVQALAACSAEVPRDANGLCVVDRALVLSQGVAEYEKLTEEFTFLDRPLQMPKGLVSSTALSVMDYTGFYFPFTGETNLNMDSPPCFLPATVLHELSHQQGVASEQACNFLAIVGSVRSEDPLYRYSGYLMGYLYLSNALYRVSPESWAAARESLPPELRLDLQNNNDYWSAQETFLTRVWNTVYDRFLKSYGTVEGLEVYGTVVRLLLQYDLI